ncbi:MAG: ribosome maturation factor RimM [Ignavibacteriaceae bacterium]|nr:MAG: ribosome maturation factor RimM [Ignavibacteriaceae bacterium]
MAKVNSVYGKGGFVRLSSFSDFPDRFLKLKAVYMEFYASFKKIVVEKVKFEGSDVIMKFEKFDSDKEAEVFAGKEVYIPDEEVVELPEDTWFIHDLIGSRVIFRGNDLGVIEDVLILPANDVYVVRKDEKEILIPAIRKFIGSFSPEEKLMILSESYPGDEV